MSAAASDRAVERGRRVFLRAARRGDAREFMALWSESEAFLRPWSPRPPEGERWDDPRRFRRYLAEVAGPTQAKFLVCRRRDGVMVGAVSIHGIERGAFQSGHMGWWLGARHTGHGYATEAVRLLIRHAFGTLGLHRVEANIRPENAPSLRLARRVGLRKEGLSPRMIKIDGAWRDHVRWAILRD